MVTRIPDGRDPLAAVAQAVAGVLGLGEQLVRERLARRLAAGWASGERDLVRALSLAAVRRDVEAVARALDVTAPALSRWAVTQGLAVGEASGDVTVTDARRRAPDLLVPRLDALSLPAVTGLAVQDVQRRLDRALSDVTRSLTRGPDDLYRRAVSLSTQLGLVTGAPGERRAAAAWQVLVDSAAPPVVDSAGRRWSTSTYVEMATRTASRRAWDIGSESTMTAAGLDLVTIVVGSGACRQCAQWAGKVLRRDAGPTGRQLMPSATGSGLVAVEIEGTLDDARAAGWRHPGCRCRPVAYLPGTRPAVDLTTYDPRAEEARARLRALERRSRQWASRAQAAVTPELAAQARARRRGVQAEIRDHVDRTGLVRQRRREQADLGLASRAPEVVSARRAVEAALR